MDTLDNHGAAAVPLPTPTPTAGPIVVIGSAQANQGVRKHKLAKGAGVHGALDADDIPMKAILGDYGK